MMRYYYKKMNIGIIDFIILGVAVLLTLIIIFVIFIGMAVMGHLWGWKN